MNDVWLVCYSVEVRFVWHQRGRITLSLEEMKMLVLHLLDDEHLYQICFIRYFVLEELW